MTPTDTPQDTVETESPRRPYRLPPYRTFIIRKYDAARTALIETMVKAHIVQTSDTGRVELIDFVIDPETGPTTRIHRVLFEVEDVEDIDRVPPPSHYVLTH